MSENLLPAVKVNYRFNSDDMFLESDLFFKFVIREAIRHQVDLETSTIQKILKEEAERLNEVERV